MLDPHIISWSSREQGHQWHANSQLLPTPRGSYNTFRQVIWYLLDEILSPQEQMLEDTLVV